jgi:hypothetical protein
MLVSRALHQRKPVAGVAGEFTLTEARATPFPIIGEVPLRTDYGESPSRRVDLEKLHQLQQ